MLLEHYMKSTKNWDRDLMSTATKKDFNFSLKNKRFHIRKNCHFIQNITEKRCKPHIALIFFVKMTLS